MRIELEKLKSDPNILIWHDEILDFYPDYQSIRERLRIESFTDDEAMNIYFEENIRKSPLFQDLRALGKSYYEAKSLVEHNKNFKVKILKTFFQALVSSTIELLDLLDYIGHYPSTYPKPLEGETEPRMEALLDRFDIMVRYHFGEGETKMRITSDDVVRLIEKIEQNLGAIDTLKRITVPGPWLLERTSTYDELRDDLNRWLKSLEEFPKSNYQLLGQSKRKEGEMVQIFQRDSMDPNKKGGHKNM